MLQGAGEGERGDRSVGVGLAGEGRPEDAVSGDGTGHRGVGDEEGRGGPWE